MKTEYSLGTRMAFSRGVGGLKIYPAMICAAVVVALYISVYFITPYWMTNDDVGMSMRAHGYGAFGRGAANLIFSNVLWGYISRACPSVAGLLGYSLSTYALLSLSAALCCWSLIRLGGGFFTAFSLVFFSYFFAFVTPQFTMTSGLTAVAAALSLKCYCDTKKIYDLILFVVLSVLSYLVRWNEFLFVAVISVPLLFQTSILKDRAFWLATLALIAVFSLAKSLDKKAYNGGEWEYFINFNEARVPFTDYGLADRLSGTDVARRYGYSDNDLALLKMWFFVDKNIAAPHLLWNLKREAAIEGSGLQMQQGVRRGIESVVNAFDFASKCWVVFLVLPLLVFSLSKRLLSAVVIFAALLFLLGYIGRPASVRVFYPGLILLLLFSFYFGLDKFKSSPKERLFAGLLVLFTVFWVCDVAANQKNRGELSQLYRMDFFDFSESMSDRLLVTWGSYFPYELVYPPLDRTAYLKEMEFYSLGSSALAPTSKAYGFELNDDTKFLTRLLSPGGIDFVGALGDEIPGGGVPLSIYCSERYSGELEVVRVISGRALGVINVKCVKNKI